MASTTMLKPTTSKLATCQHDGTATGMLAYAAGHSVLVPHIVCENCGQVLSVGEPFEHTVAGW